MSRYRQIADELRRRIETGELAPGDRVPSTREIIRQWGVAMATATKVLTELRNEGLVRAVPGVGTVVTGPPPAPRPAARPGPAGAGTSRTSPADAGHPTTRAGTSGMARPPTRAGTAGVGHSTNRAGSTDVAHPTTRAGVGGVGHSPTPAGTTDTRYPTARPSPADVGHPIAPAGTADVGHPTTRTNPADVAHPTSPPGTAGAGHPATRTSPAGVGHPTIPAGAAGAADVGRPGVEAGAADLARTRGRRGSADVGLTSARIVEVAIAVADAEGLGAVSMRRVAAELGVATMSLYRHVADKDHLLLRMMDVGLAGLEFPADPPESWRDRIELAARMLWAVFRRHPWLAPALSVTRPQVVPSAIPFTEWVLTALDGRGLDMQTMFTANVTLFNYIRGTAVNVELETEAEAASGLDNDEWIATQEPALHALFSGGRFPLFERLVTAGYDFELDALFEFGLQRLLDGIATLIDDAPRPSR